MTGAMTSITGPTFSSSAARRQIEGRRTECEYGERSAGLCMDDGPMNERKAAKTQRPTIHQPFLTSCRPPPPTQRRRTAPGNDEENGLAGPLSSPPPPPGLSADDRSSANVEVTAVKRRPDVGESVEAVDGEWLNSTRIERVCGSRYERGAMDARRARVWGTVEERPF